MKIVILDGYALNPGDLSYDVLKQFGDLAIYDRTDSEAEAIARIGDGEIVLTNKVPITDSAGLRYGDGLQCSGLRCLCPPGDPGDQCAQLRHGGGGTVYHGPAAGAVPPCGSS